MAYTYNPSPSEAATLASIAQRESGDNYSAQNPSSTASGAYQFINATWAAAAQATGVGTQYTSAAQAPAWMQDTNALWLLRTYGPDASISWGASAPAGGTSIPGASNQPLIDLSGDSASTSTADIMSSIQSSIASIDLTDPTTDVVLLAAAAAAVFLIARQ